MQGILIINKPKNFTSQDVVSKVKKILNIKKAGHTGTLDPMATGVLPVLLGDYTKLSKYLMEHDKTYIAKVKLGQKSDTGDSEGNIIESQDVDISKISKENVERVLETFLGKQKQVPPVYSAIKVNGKKLYEYAREGKEVKVEPRDIEIYDIKLLNINNLEVEFEVSCSKGTYIRSLCEDISKRLGTVGYMSSLNRILVDKFSINNAIDFKTLEETKDTIENKLFTMEDVFQNLDKIKLTLRKKELFLNGVMLTFNIPEGVYNVYDSEDNYIGLGTVKNSLLKRDVIII